MRPHRKSHKLGPARTRENDNMARQRSPLTDIRALEKRYGPVDSVDLLIADLSGTLRGKRVRRDEFDKCAKGGFVFSTGIWSKGR